MKKVKPGDIVSCGVAGTYSILGTVLESNINMWGEETIPSGIKIMWSCGETEIVYEDEIDLVRSL